MEDALLKSETLVFNIDDRPTDVYNDVKRFFEATGYLLPVGERIGNPSEDSRRKNIWLENHKMDGVRRIFDDAVVKLNADINGEWGEFSEEREVESGGIRTEKGKKSTWGKTQVTLIAQSINEGRIKQCLQEIKERFIG